MEKKEISAICYPFNAKKLTSEAARAAKYGRLVCQDAGKKIFVCSGVWAASLTREQYDLMIRPAVQRDPGNWKIEQGKDGFVDPSFGRLFRPSYSRHETKRTGWSWSSNSGYKATLCGLYSEERDCPQAVNKRYISILNARAALWTEGTGVSPIYADKGAETVAIIMPCRITAEKAAEIRSYATAGEREAKTA